MVEIGTSWDPGNYERRQWSPTHEALIQPRLRAENLSKGPYLDGLRRIYGADGVRFESFEFSMKRFFGIFDDRASPMVAMELGLLPLLMTSPEFRSAMPELWPEFTSRAQEYVELFECSFEWCVQGDLFGLPGILARHLYEGGPHSQRNVQTTEAMELAEDFVLDMAGSYQGNVCLVRMDTEWSPWFADLPWDESLSVVDLTRERVHVLCFTIEV